MLTCPYCGTETPSEYNFCVNCERQVLCTRDGCGAVLLPNKTKCLKCGELLVAEAQIQAPMTRYLHEVETTRTTHKEKREIVATDTAIGHLAPYVLNVSPIVRPQPKPPFIQSSTPSASQLPFLASNHSTNPSLPFDEESSPASVPVDEQPHVEPHVSQTAPADETLRTAQELFEVSNDELTPTVADFKGATKREQLERFLILYAWAYSHILGRPVPNAEHIKAAAKRVDLFDNNFNNYWKEVASKYLMNIEGGYKTKPAGASEAKKIIEEMKAKTEEGFPYWKGKSRTGSKAPKIDKEDTEAIKKWVTEDVDIKNIDVKILKPTEQCLLALWILTRKLCVAPAVKPRVAFEYLRTKYVTINGSADSFSVAISKTSNKHRFGRNPEGLYYLNDVGEKEVEKWLQGSPPKPDGKETNAEKENSGKEQ